MPTVIPSRSLIRRALLAAATGALLSATAALAQQPTTGTGTERSLGPSTVSPETLRRMAEQLKLLQGAKLDPKLVQDILKLRDQNPNLSNEELAEQLRGHPALQDPNQREAIRRLLEQYGAPSGGNNGPFGQGKSPPVPGMPPMPQPGERPVPGVGGPPPPLPIPNHERREGDPQPWGGRPGGMPNPPDWQDGMNRRLPPVRPAHEEDRISPETLEQRRRQFRAVAGWWENNVGPLDETPALRQLMLEMFTGRSATGEDTGSLGELLEGPAGEGFGKIADRLGGDGWKLPRFGLGKGGDGGDSSFIPPPPPSGSSFGGFSGGAGSWLPVVILLVVAATGLVLWWLWPKLMARGEPAPRPLPGLGPWPVDPRHITDREALVKAFEYLSVLVCGNGARVWNHVTIASALERAVPQAEALADPLARLYAVARYTPAGEPLPPGAIAEAREYLCELAGVPAA